MLTGLTLFRLVPRSRTLRDALSEVACGAMEDAGGWPRGPSDFDVALVAADAHTMMGPPQRLWEKRVVLRCVRVG